MTLVIFMALVIHNILQLPLDKCIYMFVLITEDALVASCEDQQGCVNTQPLRGID